MSRVTIAELLRKATALLESKGTPRLDAEVLMCHTLKWSREKLFMDLNESPSMEQEQSFLELIYRRSLGEPIAYLVGHKEFWSLDFKTTPDVLIPRPETEILIEAVLARRSYDALSLIDLGTGSGIIACSLAFERSQWSVFALDKSFAALKMAQANARNLELEAIQWIHGSWLNAFSPNSFDVVVSNPPYIDPSDPHLLAPELHYEPRAALVAQQKGLADLMTIVDQARTVLKPGGLLALEHGFDQADTLRRYFEQAAFENIETVCDLAGLDRVTLGELK